MSNLCLDSTCQNPLVLRRDPSQEFLPWKRFFHNYRQRNVCCLTDFLPWQFSEEVKSNYGTGITFLFSSASCPKLSRQYKQNACFIFLQFQINPVSLAHSPFSAYNPTVFWTARWTSTWCKIQNYWKCQGNRALFLPVSLSRCERNEPVGSIPVREPDFAMDDSSHSAESKAAPTGTYLSIW